MSRLVTMVLGLAVALGSVLPPAFAAEELPPGHWWMKANRHMGRKTIAEHKKLSTFDLCNDRTSPGQVWIIIDGRIPSALGDEGLKMAPGACRRVEGRKIEIGLPDGVKTATGRWQSLP